MTARIYTKAGDDGHTGLFGGARVAKDDPRIEACGAIDELNALLGLVRCETLPQEVDTLLARIQHNLFALGAELSTPDPAKMGTKWIDPPQIAWLEEVIDLYDAQTPPLTQFILPGGSRGASLLHVARTACRRAERRAVTLAANSREPVSPLAVVYLNRLGDLLFVLARHANARAGIADEPWQKPDEQGA